MSKILRVILIVVAVIILAFVVMLVYFKFSTPKPFVDENIYNRYSVLQNEKLWRSKEIESNDSKQWNIININTSIKNEGDGNFLCGDKKALFAKYYSFSDSRFIGAWNNISIVDCSDYYFVFESGDRGPKLFGPFK